MKILLLWLLVALTAASGAWLLLSPTLERQAAQNEVDRLITAMEAETAAEPEAAVYYTDTEPDVVVPLTVDIAVTYEPEAVATAPDAETTPEPTPRPETGAGLGILTIEKLDLKLPVVEGVTEKCLKTAVGRVPETAAIGEAGNAVIAGHRSYTYGKFFNRLGEMAVGDIITYTPQDGEAMRFEVFEIAEISPGDQIAFIQPADEAIITLYTCTPVREATHRLLVRATKI